MLSLQPKKFGPPAGPPALLVDAFLSRQSDAVQARAALDAAGASVAAAFAAPALEALADLVEAQLLIFTCV